MKGGQREKQQGHSRRQINAVQIRDDDSIPGLLLFPQ